MNIGSRLKEILEERNLTVSQVAREADISPQTLYAMINRDSNKADMDILARLLLALDMDFMEFLKLDPIEKKENASRLSAPKKASSAQTTGAAKKPETAAKESGFGYGRSGQAKPKPVQKDEKKEEPVQPVRRVRELEVYLL